jgi:hypothetical protein
MNSGTRVAAYLSQIDGLTLTPTQRRRVRKKARAEEFRVVDDKPIGRYARLRKRFDRRNHAATRRAASHGGALWAWQQIVSPGARSTGGARSNPRHPSRKHDVNLRPTRVYVDPTQAPAWSASLAALDVTGMRRPARRALARQLAKS